MLQNYINRLLAISGMLMLSACSQHGLVAPAGETAGNSAAPISVQRDYQAVLSRLEVNDDEAAAELLEKFIGENPEYPGAYINLAIIRERQEQSDEAVELLNQALALRSDSVTAMNQLGVLQRQRGEFAAAEEQWLKAIQTDPEYTYAWYNLGVLYDLYLQDLPSALEHYKRYQALTDSAEQDPAVARWVTDIERRIGTPARAAQAREVQ